MDARRTGSTSPWTRPPSPIAAASCSTGHGAWRPRLERLKALSGFLAKTPYAEAAAEYLQGDASTRSYARLVLPDRSAILMNAPRQPDGPPIRDGKPYSALVHLAEDVAPFVAVGEELRRRGLAAPAIYAFDLDQGFLIIEDLGDRVFGAEIAHGTPIAELYAPAVDVLLAIAGDTATAAAADRGPRAAPAARPTTPGLCSPRPCCSPTGSGPRSTAARRPQAVRDEFLALWQPLLAAAASSDNALILRDFHSPNLMWLPERAGLRRVGLLDFQDALLGPCRLRSRVAAPGRPARRARGA